MCVANGYSGTSMAQIHQQRENRGLVEAQATVRRAGRRRSFGSSEFTVDGRLVLAASGVFAIESRT